MFWQTMKKICDVQKIGKVEGLLACSVKCFAVWAQCIQPSTASTPPSQCQTFPLITSWSSGGENVQTDSTSLGWG